MAIARPRHGSLLGIVALSASLIVLVPGVEAAPRTPGPTKHSSDGVRGPTIQELLSDEPTVSARRAAEPEQSWRIAPGVTYREWTTTLRQGDVRLHLLTGDLGVDGVELDLVNGRRLTQQAPLSHLLDAAGARAGVNADFFDIADTGAPLGTGRQTGRGLVQGARNAWGKVFTVAADGTARVGTSPLAGRIVRKGSVVADVHGFNDPVLQGNEIGLYTSVWGKSPGRRVAEGADVVRQVVIRAGRVRSKGRPRAGVTIKGRLLIGRDRGAAALRKLKVGQRVSVSRQVGVAGDRMAVSGSVQLLHDGSLTTGDDRELHPRTAIGYSRDTEEVFLLVADGRSTTSKGLTLVQLARRLQALGAEEALNLDGGGSSTLVAPGPLGAVGVRNEPSDGVERRIPNGVVLRW